MWVANYLPGRPTEGQSGKRGHGKEGINVYLEEGLRIERDPHNRIASSQDFKEARRAFAEKKETLLAG